MTDPPSLSIRWRRPLIGAAISLAVFVLARMLAAIVYPIGMHPFENKIFFLGTPFLALAFSVPGVSTTCPLSLSTSETRARATWTG